MARKKMRPSKDKATFARTAQTTRKININPKIYRGGIRL